MPSVEEYINDFIYSGDKTQLTIAYVAKTFEIEASGLIDKLDLFRIEMQEKGFDQNDIYKTVEAFLKYGKDVKTIKGISKDFPIDTVRTIFEPFYNRQDRLVREMTEKLVARPIEQFDREHPDLIYRWKLGIVKTKHCEDCLFLSEQKPRTVEEWRKFKKGLPREGGTACSVGCNCMLEIVTGEFENIEETAISDKGFVPAKTVKKPWELLGGYKQQPVDKVKSTFDITKTKAYTDKAERAAYRKKHHLTQEEFSSLRSYSSIDYRPMNQYLRGQIDYNDFLAKVKIPNVSSENIIKHIDSSIEKNIYNIDKVYRGIDSELAKKLKPGKVLKDSGFLSTTKSRKVAYHFTDPENTFLLEIQVPKNKKSIFLDPRITLNIEDEILFGRGSRLLIKSISIKGKETVIKCLML